MHHAKKHFRKNVPEKDNPRSIFELSFTTKLTDGANSAVEENGVAVLQRPLPAASGKIPTPSARSKIDQDKIKMYIRHSKSLKIIRKLRIAGALSVPPESYDS